MSLRERADMTIVTFLFGSFVAAFSAFSILINQIFVSSQPSSHFRPPITLDIGHRLHMAILLMRQV
jgi:hypothetical protein